MTDLIGWEGDLPLATFAATTPLRPSPTKMSTFVMRLTTRLSPSAENDSDKHISCTSTGRRALGRDVRLPQILFDAMSKDAASVVSSEGPCSTPCRTTSQRA